MTFNEDVQRGGGPHEIPRAYARGIFGGIRRSIVHTYLDDTEDIRDAFIRGLTPTVFCEGGSKRSG
ncbi:MAG: hypothetical protein A3B37_01190 [Candidatus Sungbacteria bacterium RIFCSPLOWO2_01_FULL_59_16]|uniref:Uncharacterized protein n=1 Tax=Candidatus Sungbacteria bacterium RIFCSPLOWO2_01_FULL_59_16 TaxID=1802280 RepID=A0A1G2LC16_9BACT|nr:MAG: hypothetical protein A3B37_01190 [Candidatus Sungbacteria bacterium RIFCSPLOWO2_01_FULL_59_16]